MLDYFHNENWVKVEVVSVDYHDEKVILSIEVDGKMTDIPWPNNNLDFCGVHTESCLCSKRDLRPDRALFHKTFAFVDLA